MTPDELNRVIHDEERVDSQATMAEILSYLNGSMSQLEREEFEAWLTISPQLRADVDDLRRDQALEQRESSGGDGGSQLQPKSPTSATPPQTHLKAEPKNVSYLFPGLALAASVAAIAFMAFNTFRPSVSAQSSGIPMDAFERQKLTQQIELERRRADEQTKVAEQRASEANKYKDEIKQLQAIVNKDSGKRGIAASEVSKLVLDLMFERGEGTHAGTEDQTITNLSPNIANIYTTSIELSWTIKTPSSAVHVILEPATAALRQKLNWNSDAYQWTLSRGNRQKVSLPPIPAGTRGVEYRWTVEANGATATGGFIHLSDYFAP